MWEHDLREGGGGEVLIISGDWGSMGWLPEGIAFVYTILCYLINKLGVELLVAICYVLAITNGGMPLLNEMHFMACAGNALFLLVISVYVLFAMFSSGVT